MKNLADVSVDMEHSSSLETLPFNNCIGKIFKQNLCRENELLNERC